METRHVYTVAETARMLRVHPNTVRRYAKRGELPFIRMGTRILILAAPLKALLCHAESTLPS